MRGSIYFLPTVTTKYVYNGPQVIAEYDDSSGTMQLERKFIYGPGIDEPIAMIDVDAAGDTWYFYHYDGLGSVIALSKYDSTLQTPVAVIVERYEYTPFGKTTVIDLLRRSR